MAEVKRGDRAYRMGRELNHLTDDDRRARGIELWCRYHVETELAERQICKFRDEQDNARPVFDRERQACNEAARQVMKSLGLSPSSFPAEREEVSSWPLAKQMRYLEGVANVRDKIIAAERERVESQETPED